MTHRGPFQPLLFCDSVLHAQPAREVTQRWGWRACSGEPGSVGMVRAAWAAAKGKMSQQSPRMCNHPGSRWRRGRCSGGKNPGSRERPESRFPSFLQRPELDKAASQRKRVYTSRLPGSPFVAPCCWTLPRRLRRARPSPTHVCPQQPVSQCNCHRLVPLCKNNRRRKSTFVSSSSIDTAGRAGAGGGFSSGGPRAPAHSLCSSGGAGRGKAPSPTSYGLAGRSQSIPWPVRGGHQGRCHPSRSRWVPSEPAAPGRIILG